jgi:hypothetical protein
MKRGSALLFRGSLFRTTPFRAISLGKMSFPTMSLHSILILFAVALSALGAGPRIALAQAPADCSSFQRLSDVARQKADAVQAAMKAKVDRKQICGLMTSFVSAEANVIQFLEANKTWCGVPDQAIAVSKANHEKSVKFRTMACNDDAPHPKAPSLSDAIKLPTVDSASNTKTGRGTLDTLTGNPLGR